LRIDLTAEATSSVRLHSVSVAAVVTQHEKTAGASITAPPREVDRVRLLRTPRHPLSVRSPQPRRSRPALKLFADDAHFRFPGRHPLAAEYHSKAVEDDRRTRLSSPDSETGRHLLDVTSPGQSMA
jgi:hypothetical protein